MWKNIHYGIFYQKVSLRCTDIPEIGSPTIVMIVDSDELQEQGIKLFAKIKKFLNIGGVKNDKR